MIHQIWGGGGVLPVLVPAYYWSQKGFQIHTKVPKLLQRNGFHYPTVLVIVQKARETSTNVPRYCTVGIVQYCARAHPVTLVVFFQVTGKGWKRPSWIINLLLDISVWSIAVYFYSLFVFWVGSSKYSTTRKNIRRYFTPKHLIRYIYIYCTDVRDFLVNDFHSYFGQVHLQSRCSVCHSPRVACYWWAYSRSSNFHWADSSYYAGLWRKVRLETSNWQRRNDRYCSLHSSR